ncbi:hypothetical protein LY76DRAFT_221856 [Colletotrichum caudatum]|nr:hypothetical protein LY76DRAFT_221856 [Colletotrichum caudatum]
MQSSSFIILRCFVERDPVLSPSPIPSDCHHYHAENRGHQARHAPCMHGCFGRGTTGRVNKCHLCLCIPCVVVSPSPVPVCVALAESSWNASVPRSWMDGAPLSLAIVSKWTDGTCPRSNGPHAHSAERRFRSGRRLSVPREPYRRPCSFCNCAVLCWYSGPLAA